MTHADLVAELQHRAARRFAEARDAHATRRRAAAAGLAVLDTLPAIHKDAAWKLALRAVPGLTGTAADLRAAIQFLPAPPRGGTPQPLRVAESVAARIATLTPPAHEADEYGVRLARGDESEIRAAAEQMAAWGKEDRAARETVRGRVPPARRGTDEEPWVREERACPLWWRRRLRRSAKRAQVWYDTALRLAQAGTAPYVSAFTLAAHRQRQENAARWSSGQVVSFDNGTTVSLPEIQKSAKKARRATTYAVLKGMEYFGEREGYTAFFVTLTLPGAYHSVIKGGKLPDGTYNTRPNQAWTAAHGPAAAWEALTALWGQCRARLAKHEPLRSWFGISVPEPHHDGTPHLHALVWLPTNFESAGRRRSTGLVLKDILADLAPGRQSRLEIVRKRPDRTLPDGRVTRSLSPASYILKYVAKNALDDDESRDVAGEAGERHRAWASSRGIRRVRLVGAHGSLRVWQRLWTSDDNEPLPERAAAARAAMRESRAAGERATAAAPDSAERQAARVEQAAASAEALALIGALPGATRKLCLGYDATLTEYGRPTRRAARRESKSASVVGGAGGWRQERRFRSNGRLQPSCR